MKLNIVKHRKIWYSISGLSITLSLLALLVWGLNFGIDFTGGSLLEVDFAAPPTISEVRAVLASADYSSASVQSSGDTGLLIRTGSLDETRHLQLFDLLNEHFGEATELRFDSIGPVIGQELRRTALIGAVITLLLIGTYIALAFRKVTGSIASWKYGFLTIFAAFHDMIIAIGAFAILGHYFGWEVGATFVAASLTILGYSINDTVVVFDRTRENLKNYIGDTLAETVDLSINQTFRRSLYTSLTTLLALAAIFIWGGDTTRPFALALIIGIGVGTYSSIFIASPLLVDWERK